MLIHGTFAGDESDRGESWWQRGSTFCEGLQKELGEGYEVQPAVFHWSGDNDEAARREAGEALLDWLTRKFEGRVPYHLVAHSHGGSVVWETLRLSDERRTPLHGLASTTTLASPFLIYRSTLDWMWSALPTVVAVGGLITSALYVPQYVDHLGEMWRDRRLFALLGFPGSWLLLLAISVAGLAVFMNGARSLAATKRKQQHWHPAFKEHGPNWLGIWSESDEAINALKSSVTLGGDLMPRLFASSPRLSRIYEKTLAKLGNEFVWSTIRRKAQGTDSATRAIVQVTPHPHGSEAGWEPLPINIESELLRLTKDAAAETVQKLRQRLGWGAEHNRDLEQLLGRFGEALTFRELIHNSYFELFSVVQLIALHITSSAPTHRRSDLTATEPPWMTAWYRAGISRLREPWGLGRRKLSPGELVVAGPGGRTG